MHSRSPFHLRRPLVLHFRPELMRLHIPLGIAYNSRLHLFHLLKQAESIQYIYIIIIDNCFEVCHIA